MVIYKTVNKINGMYYIGKDKHNNPNYLGSGLHLKRAIKKYGKENFKKIILIKCSSYKSLNEEESKIINERVIRNKMSYNIALGGQGGDLFTWKQKIEMGINLKISNSRKGKKLSENHKNSIRRGLSKYKNNNCKKVYKNPNKIKNGKDNPFYGEKHTGDLSRFGKHMKGKTPTNALRVLCINNNTTYNSIVEAAKSLNFNNISTARRAISDVCKNKRDDYRGYKFKFI